MLPTMESWSMIGSKGIVVVLPIDTLKWRKDKEYVRYRDLFLPKGNKIVWERVVIPNSGFTLSLFSDYEEPGYHYLGKSYSNIHLVKLEHPELAKYPFTIATYMESRNLISLMAKSRNILEGELSGKFCCIHVSSTSGIWHTVFDIEDPSDKKMEERKGIGKIISEGKGTTKWKVGYQYVTKTEKTFIYLGDINGGWLKPAYGDGFGDSLPTGFSCAVNKTSETLALILDTTSLEQDEKDILKGIDNTIYVLVGDGEMDEGIVWESLMSICHFGLDNMVIVVDKNNYQLDGPTDEIMGLSSLESKLQAFGLDVETIDGHSIEALIHSLSLKTGKPRAIVANTIKAHGISFLENNKMSHQGILSKKKYEKAVEEIRSAYNG